MTGLCCDIEVFKNRPHCCDGPCSGDSNMSSIYVHSAEGVFFLCVSCAEKLLTKLQADLYRLRKGK